VRVEATAVALTAVAIVVAGAEIGAPVNAIRSCPTDDSRSIASRGCPSLKKRKSRWVEQEQPER